jgi:hypothetical protein
VSSKLECCCVIVSSGECSCTVYFAVECSCTVSPAGERGCSSLGRYVFGSEISYNKPPPRLPGLGC